MNIEAKVPQIANVNHVWNAPESLTYNPIFGGNGPGTGPGCVEGYMNSNQGCGLDNGIADGSFVVLRDEGRPFSVDMINEIKDDSCKGSIGNSRYDVVDNIKTFIFEKRGAILYEEDVFGTKWCVSIEDLNKDYENMSAMLTPIADSKINIEPGIVDKNDIVTVDLTDVQPDLPEDYCSQESLKCTVTDDLSKLNIESDGSKKINLSNAILYLAGNNLTGEQKVEIENGPVFREIPSVSCGDGEVCSDGSFEANIPINSKGNIDIGGGIEINALKVIEAFNNNIVNSEIQPSAEPELVVENKNIGVTNSWPNIIIGSLSLSVIFVAIGKYAVDKWNKRQKKHTPKPVELIKDDRQGVIEVPVARDPKVDNKFQQYLNNQNSADYINTQKWLNENDPDRQIEANRYSQVDLEAFQRNQQENLVSDLKKINVKFPGDEGYEEKSDENNKSLLDNSSQTESRFNPRSFRPRPRS